ncbi:MAG: hypothetical protein AAFW83_07955 [Pseudomonadota bacterium]
MVDPKFQILERFTHAKRADNAYTEDRFVIGPHGAGVIDGAIGPHHTDTTMITAALNAVVEYLEALGPGATARQTIDQVSAILADTKTAAGLTEFRYTGGFHLVFYHGPSRQLWRVGDCQFRHSGQTFTNDLEVEAIGARQRAVMVEAMRLRGQSDEEIMASDAYAELFTPFFAPLLDFAHRTDHPLGFGVINGMPVPDQFIEKHDLSTVSGVSGALVMASDGYPVVCDTLADTEARLASLLVRDPMCIHEHICSKGLRPGQCSFDDRTYLRIKIG